MTRIINIIMAIMLSFTILTACADSVDVKTVESETQNQMKKEENDKSAEAKNVENEKIEESTEVQNIEETSEQEGNALNTLNAGNVKIASPSVNGQLKVDGTNLVDQNGNIVQLRGVSTHGIAWFPDYINQDCVNDLKSWGANVFRLAMYTHEYAGYCSGGDKEQLKKLVRQGVNYATNADMYCIVDWHVLNEGSPKVYENDAKEFWNQMSQELSGHNNVLYEICNEPCNGANWSDVKSYAETIIPIIRANDPDAVIIIGTPNWSQYVDQAAADPVDGENLMYALHFYAATHKQELRDKLIQAHNEGLPIFVSEYGICDASGNGEIDEAEANTWIELLNSYNISYVCWNLSNKDESSAIISSGCSKTSGLTDEDLSQEGKWLKAMLLKYL